MLEKPSVLELIYATIDEVNQTRPPDRQVQKRPETALFGSASILDSLGLVNVIVGVEQRIAEQFGIAVTLADEKAMSQRNSPFRTIDTLADYVLSLANA
ncbi:MAG TPA: hypothetical protein VH370_20290 [Humisphaera sp.]|nr:hypothetical protein [Humisphaera sp.]